MHRRYSYSISKLNDAIERVSNAPTVQEGLLAAYIEDIQWLYELDDHPVSFLRGLIDFSERLTSADGSDMRSRVSATIAKLDDHQAVALAENLTGLTRLLESLGGARDADTAAVAVAGAGAGAGE